MKNNVLCFWRETDLPTGVLSQWYHKPFQDESGETFSTAEHYMMWRKAKLFNDHHIAKMILEAKHPRDVKALGRKVKNFNNEIWEKERLKIVIDGNLLKFSQHDDLKRYLLNTEDKELIEASPYDAIWGIGINKYDYFAGKPYHGLNLLGKALMSVRKQLKEQ